ncbi:MAG: hypothetical protein M3Z23_02905 [Acidobacteriota bacterium]|nr:hypothetical protein [Acidobacteriota bacterium]
MRALALAVCLASLALGQNVTRVFTLTNATAVTSLQEIATTVRTVGQIQQLSVDNALGALTVKGTSDQIALAEWLVPKLDVAGTSFRGPQDYWVGGNSDDVVLVLDLAHATTRPGLQEIITTLRTVAEIQKIFMVTAPKIVTLRGNAGQIALARFLIPALNAEINPAPPATESHIVSRFKMGNPSNDTVLVYALAHANSPQSVQAIITTLRGVLDIQRIFQVSSPKLLAMRGSSDQVRMIEWLIPELDRETANTGGNEARVPGGNDDVVHVFYLSRLTSMESLIGLLKELRSIARFPRASVQNAPAALVLRGTADQIALAGRTIELRDRAN